MSNSNDVKPTVEELRCKLQEEQSRTSYSRNKCTNYQTQLLAQGAKIVHLNAESVQTANALLQERQVQKSLAAELTEARAMLKEEHAQRIADNNEIAGSREALNYANATIDVLRAQLSVITADHAALTSKALFMQKLIDSHNTWNTALVTENQALSAANTASTTLTTLLQTKLKARSPPFTRTSARKRHKVNRLTF